MNARETVRAYYDALRAGEPLAPYVADERDGDDPYAKVGVSERLVGSDRIREGLRTQTETTTDWRVESRALRVSERDDVAWFSDAVALAWTDAASGERRAFDTRWSGTLARRPDGWRFVSLHVSAADEL
jgi:hypothetical protein